MQVEVTTDDVKLESGSEYAMGTPDIVQKANELYPDTYWSGSNLSELLITLMKEIEELRKLKK